MLKSLKLAGALLCGLAFTAVAQDANQQTQATPSTDSAVKQADTGAGPTAPAATTTPAKKKAGKMKKGKAAAHKGAHKGHKGAKKAAAATTAPAAGQ